VRSSTLQFIVAGALVAAWAWMLGRPLLTNLFRRSRRDSVGHFRYQQAVLSQQAGYVAVGGRRWADRPRPIHRWRSQPRQRRRLQTMLGFAMATFFALLLAIALRGLFIRLLLVMALCSLTYVSVAAFIGSRELKRLEIRRRRDAAARMAERSAESEERSEPGSETESGPSIGSEAKPERSVLFPDPLPEPAAADLAGLADLEGFGTGEFDDDFFEPIPGLTFEPLNLDSSILEGDGGDGHRTLFGSDRVQPGPLFGEDFSDRPNAKEIVEELVGRHGSVDFFDESDLEEAVASEDESEARHDHDSYLDVSAEDSVDESPDEDESNSPTFTAPAGQQPRPAKRNKARPIYIEAQLDENGERIQAVNDR